MGPILDRLRKVLSFVPDQQAKGKRYNHFDAVAAWANVKSGIVDRLMTDRDRAELEMPSHN